MFNGLWEACSSAQLAIDNNAAMQHEVADFKCTSKLFIEVSRLEGCCLMHLPSEITVVFAPAVWGCGEADGMPVMFLVRLGVQVAAQLHRVNLEIYMHAVYIRRPDNSYCMRECFVVWLIQVQAYAGLRTWGRCNCRS